MNENIRVKGRLKVDTYRDGKLVTAGEWRDNVITAAGKAALASLLNSATAGNTVIGYMAFGTGTTAPAEGDTQLATEVSAAGYSRQAVTRSNPSANTAQYIATLSGVENVVVNEAGLYDLATGGVLFAHQLTGAVTLTTAADSIQITWQVTFS